MTGLPLSSYPELAERYAFERELGRGGMATVYLAREVKHARPVAVKILDPAFGPGADGDRFQREILIAARLAHPHLVPLIDSGDIDGVPYYVSAFAPGGSLRDRLRAEGPLAVADAVRIATEVGSALDYVHREGFVHRDVKPENVLFADGHALLADFGIARSHCAPDAAPAPAEQSVTAAGIALGTPEYMSPEQATGGDDVGPLSDVYSLGCVVFEMLAGEPPFSGGGARATLARQVTETPRPLRELRPDVPAAVEAAVARALAKDPAHRWPSVSAFAAALRAEGEAPRTLPAVTQSVAVLPFVNASPEPENEYLSDGITDELIDALAKVEGIRVASRTSTFALKGRALDVRAIGALLGCSTVLEGTVRRAGQQLRVTAQLTSTEDGRLLWSQRFDRRLDDVFALQDELARTIVDTLRVGSFVGIASPPSRRRTDNPRAYELYLKGRYEWNRRTQQAIRAAVGYFEQAIAEDPRFALAYTGLADCYALEVDYRSVPVHEGFARAKEYVGRAIALDDTLAEAHTSLGWCLFIYDWAFDAAGREFRRAIALDPHYATAHQWHAFLHTARGEIAESLVEAHTAVELDPGSVSARRSLGFAYYFGRRWDQARWHLERALAMDPNSEETCRVLGLTLAMAGELEDARHVLTEAVRTLGAGSYTRAALGYVLARLGRDAEARGVLAELESRASTEYVSPVAFATLHLGLGDVDAAMAHAERALDDRRGWLVYLRVTPMLDIAHGHPRFEALARRVGL